MKNFKLLSTITMSLAVIMMSSIYSQAATPDSSNAVNVGDSSAVIMGTKDQGTTISTEDAKKLVKGTTVTDLYGSITSTGNTGATAIAHRGLSATAPQNTTQAIELACDQGFKVIEFDVRQTSDGKFIVCHDATVDKITNGTGRVSNMTFKELRKLKVDINPNYKKCKLASLEEVLKICKKHKVTPLVDTKDVRDTKAFLKIMKKYGFKKTGMVTSDKLSTLVSIRKQNKSMKLILINSTDANNAIKLAVKNKLNGVSLNSKIANQDSIKAAKQNGLITAVWTINSEDAMGSLTGADYIITDGIIK